jgi:CDP-paratose 2-epimerase
VPGVILVTGGAGFIGSSLAIDFKQRHPERRVIAFDNLRRRGAELNVARLRAAGVEFTHGDVRVESDLAAFAHGLDVLVECSAEPSVLAGRDGQVRYVVDTNLSGCVNCLELARTSGAAFVFLSTSRVYPTATLCGLRYDTRGQRFVLRDEQPVAGVSGRGVAESFPLDGVRTLYGATKLASELLIAEYVDMFGLHAIINRCGVVSGAWQMGHAEQGVFAHWMFAHAFNQPLAYIGFGGHGHQVRDVLHVGDLADLIHLQLAARGELRGEVFNAGGGAANSVSLAEFSHRCAALTGTRLDVAPRPDTRPGDVPIYITDNAKVEARFGWTPRRSVDDIARDLFQWVTGHADALRATLSSASPP